MSLTKVRQLPHPNTPARQNVKRQNANMNTRPHMGAGLYDIHIKLKRIPFLEWEPSHDTNFLMVMCDLACRGVVVR
jgi:hypothetical protein